MILQNKLKLASILFLVISFVSAAQSSEIPPPPMIGPPPPPGLPIDGNVAFVLVLGLVVGVYYRIKLSKPKTVKKA
jgi:hypothetical protein